MLYLDHSATTKPHPDVLKSYVAVSEQYFGNPSSLHGLGAEAETLLCHARKQIGSLLGAKDQEVVFTSGGTEGNNLAIKGTALRFQGRGKHCITTCIEHPSVLEAFKQLEDLGFEVTYLPVNKRGVVAVADVEAALRPDTILVSVMYVNNEVGSLQPIEQIGQLLKHYPKVLFHTDAVQAIGHVPVSFHLSGVDLMTLSGHKFQGLKGTGALLVRSGVRIAPLFSGGEQELALRAGTQNVPGNVALAKAVRIAVEAQPALYERLKKMQAWLIDRLSARPDCVVHSSVDSTSPHIVNFSVARMKPEVVVGALTERKIFISTRSACSSKLKQYSTTVYAMTKDESLADTTLRVSFGHDTTQTQMESFFIAFEDALKQLRL
ncbi:MAG: cysteine desulfurase family protein [Bacilli bacterium]